MKQELVEPSSKVTYKNQTKFIQNEFKKQENGKLATIDDSIERKEFKSKIYTEIEKKYGIPRATIRRAVNAHLKKNKKTAKN